MANKNKMGPFAYIKGAIRDEISALIFKVLVGVVLASTIVYAIFHAGQAFQTLAHQFENGYIFELIVFGLLAVVASSGLYLLFQNSVERSAIQNRDSLNLASIDYDLLLFKFTEGFVEGLVTKEEPKPIDETFENGHSSRL